MLMYMYKLHKSYQRNLLLRRHGCAYGRIAHVVFHHKVFVYELVDVDGGFGDAKGWEVVNLVLKLCRALIDVVGIHVCVSQVNHQLVARQTAYVRDHACEHCVAHDVERKSQKDVRGSLRQRATQTDVAHVKLAQTVSRR